uniref:Uncharacterized protein n=1 Tax=Knipowitschia caucasica TaxID=637954 RepID=A0AAV2LXK3_KNICA
MLLNMASFNTISPEASTPYSLESESLRMDCIMSGGASPTLGINNVTNKAVSVRAAPSSQSTSPSLILLQVPARSPDPPLPLLPSPPSYGDID